MINFKEFIDKDINAKKTLISTLPTKTKTNKKKVNSSIDSMKKKYESYQASVKKYLIAKSRSFSVKEKEKDYSKLSEEITSLEYVKFLLNPSNTYFEKMNFDDLLYQLSNSYLFNFNSLNEIINSFLDKFQLIGVALCSDDFDYTCYVHEYMSSFLEVRYSKDKKYDKVSEIFERIYWSNPELIQHIEINFRKLIRNNEKKFKNYISKIQKDVMLQNNIKSYSDCIEKLKEKYFEYKNATKENLSEIVELFVSGKIDINQYMENNNFRKTAYASLITSNVDYNDLAKMDKICKALENLKNNIIEFNNFNEFVPLFQDFKTKYEPLLKENLKDYKGLKNVEEQIIKAEKELNRLNHRIFIGKKNLFEFTSEKTMRNLKVQSVVKAKELYELYSKYDEEYFKVHVLDVLSPTMNIYDILHLYYSFSYFKNIAIQRVFELSEYSEISEYSDKFDKFAKDCTNVIITGVPAFEETNIPKIIANKYRLNNLNITEEQLQPESLQQLLDYISLILRINIINNSEETSLEKIWFMTQVQKILNADQKD